MMYELTLCNVARLGAASGFDTMIQLNRFLISTLLAVGWRLTQSSLPFSSTNEQMMARAAPTTISLASGPAMRILGSGLLIFARLSSSCNDARS